MSGYTPLFDSLTTGTLCGRWPDVGLWPIVLSLADRHGVVDYAPDYLARVTGLAIGEIQACMNRFCEPDPNSRSTDEGGARLVLIDPEHRDWGWRVVNHAKYRERARKQMQQIDATASGRDAERKRRDRERRSSSVVQPSPANPAESSADRPSDSDSDSDSDKNKNKKAGAPRSKAKSGGLHAEVIEAFHEVCPMLPKVKVWTDQRRKALDARIAERKAAGRPADKVDYWRGVFTEVAASDFLTGQSTNFRADLSWLVKSENFAKVIEGRYTNNRPTTGGRPRG